MRRKKTRLGRLLVKAMVILLLFAPFQIGDTGSYFVATANSTGNSVTAGDWEAPVTSINALPAYESTASFNLDYSATDSFSGVHHLELYISHNGGPYAKYNGNYTPGDIMNFDSATTGGDGEYRFYSIGTDNASPPNVEAAPLIPDATTIVDTTDPVANAGPDQAKNTGQDVTFDGSGSSDANGIASYKWDKDASDGVNFGAPDLTGVSPTLSGGYGTPGVYTVTLQVADNAGHTATDTMMVTVTPPSETVTVRLFPVADSYMSSKTGEVGDNFGDKTEMKVNSKTGDLRRSILRFDLSTLPPGSTINSCNLKLYMHKAPSASRTYGVHRLSSFENTWTEDGISWNNYKSGSVWGTAGGDFNVGTTATAATNTDDGVTLAWNVTGDCGLGNRSWVVKDEAEGSGDTEGKFRTKEEGGTAKDPYLEVNYTAPAVATDHVVVNEVYYDVGSGKGTEPANEWVELYNPTSSSVDISGWKICDASSSCDTIPSSPSIPAYGFAVITDASSTWGFWSIPPEAIKIALGTNIGNNLDNSNERVILKNASDIEQDAVSYGTDTYAFDPAVVDVDSGWSIARLIKGYDTNSASDFWANPSPNPGTNPERAPEFVAGSQTSETPAVVTADPIATPSSVIQEATPSAVVVADSVVLATPSATTVVETPAPVATPSAAVVATPSEQSEPDPAPVPVQPETPTQ